VADAKYPVQSPEHALQAGFVWGVAIDHGLDLTPDMDDEGNYTASFVLNLPEPMAGVAVRIIVEAPVVPA